MKVEGDIFEYNSMKRKQVFVSDILYFQAVINYSIMHLKGNRKIVLSACISKLLRLFENDFERLHQSIICKKGVYRIDFENQVFVEHKKIGHVSRRNKQRLGL